MSSNIDIDPVTKKEFQEAAGAAFDSVVAELGEIDWEEIDYQAIAEMFFFNGFLQGCLAMTDEGNTDLKETLYMLKQEIAYQTKEK